ncbi:MAG: Rrf2 family transcriptional regulator [Parvularculaceae bacterium]
MPASTRFAVSVHTLVALAEARPAPLTSERLAASVNTNPAVVRRLLTALSAAGLTKTRLGKGGGATLARGPRKITLLDVYRAVETPGLVALHRTPPDPDCPVGRNIQTALLQSTARAEEAFLSSLGETTLKQVVKAVRAREAA